MVVEDELIVAEDLQHWLTALGYSVRERAATGAEAIRRCEVDRPDLVLMDIMLAGPMDGIEAAEQIRTKFDIPVVYLTASSDEGTLSRAKVTEPFGYILKPYDERGLFTTIEMALYKHQSEKRLRESEERFRLLFEHAPVAFQSLNADGRVVQVNKAWEELLGYTGEEVLGRWFGDVLTPSSVERFIRNFTQFKLTHGTEPVEFELVRKDGTVFTAYVRGNLAFDAHGMFEVNQCILERPVRDEPDARGVPHREGLVDVNKDPLLVVGGDGIIVGSNGAARDLVGGGETFAAGRPLSAVVLEPGRVQSLLSTILRDGRVSGVVLTVRTARGSDLPLVVTGCGERDAAGPPSTVFLMLAAAGRGAGGRS
jgi:PAS domain S-box-containing protein